MSLPPPIPPTPPAFPPSPSSAAPDSQGGGVYRFLANFSWLSILLVVAACVVMALVTKGDPGKVRTAGMIFAGVIMALALAGFACGSLALIGLSKHGRKGILIPALTGLILWVFVIGFGLLTALAVPSFLRARERALAASKPIVLGPVLHMPDAVRVEDPEAGFSLELPPGFQPLPPDPKKEYTHRFQGQAAGGTPAFVLIKRHAAVFPRRRLLLSDLPKGQSLSLTTFSWRGVEIDGVRVPENTANGSFVTFNMQVPLRQQMLQIGVGGSPAAEDELRGLAGRVLESLEGDPKR